MASSGFERYRDMAAPTFFESDTVQKVPILTTVLMADNVIAGLVAQLDRATLS